MAHKTLIGGTAYEITGGKTLIDGTAYSIASGKTLIGGTAYEVGFVGGTKILTLTFGEYADRSGYLSVTVDGVTYDSDTVIEVSAGTVVELVLYSDSSSGTYASVTINGERHTGGAYGVYEYDYIVTKDATIYANSNYGSNALGRYFSDYVEITEE